MVDSAFWISLPAVITASAAAVTAAVATLRTKKKTTEIAEHVAPNGRGQSLVQLVENIDDKLDQHIADHHWDGNGPVPQRRASDPKFPGWDAGSSGSIGSRPGDPR